MRERNQLYLRIFHVSFIYDLASTVVTHVFWVWIILKFKAWRIRSPAVITLTRAFVLRTCPLWPIIIPADKGVKWTYIILENEYKVKPNYDLAITVALHFTWIMSKNTITVLIHHRHKSSKMKGRHPKHSLRERRRWWYMWTACTLAGNCLRWVALRREQLEKLWSNHREGQATGKDGEADHG